MKLRLPSIWSRTTDRPKVYLHVGAMKTGTTYLQQVLSINKVHLAAAGILFPGVHWAEHGQGVRQILSGPDGSEATGSWRRLVDEMLAHPGAASVISMEFLSFASPEQAARVMASLTGAEVHVILTVRDAKGSIPAQWQTLCRNGNRLSLPKFVRALRLALAAHPGPVSPAVRKLRRTQDIVRMLDVWGTAVGPDRLHIITVPPKGSEPRLLWERFARVIGVDPAVAVRDPGRRNASLGLPSTELLRRVSIELIDLHRADYQRIFRTIARTELAARAAVEPRVTLNRRGQRLAARWNRSVRKAIVSSGAEWVGSPEDLPVDRPDPSEPKAAATVRPQDLLAAAAAARDGMLDRLAILESGIPTSDVADSVARQARPGAAATTPEHWESATDPVREAVSEVADLVRTYVALTLREDGATPAFQPAE
jgi:hypothetical protein